MCHTPVQGLLACSEALVVRLSALHFDDGATSRGAFNARLSSRQEDRPASGSLVAAKPELERLPAVHRRHVLAGEGQGAGIVFALEVTAIGEWERDDVCPGRPLDPHIGMAAPAEHVLFPQLLAELTRLILDRSVCEADALAEIGADAEGDAPRGGHAV